MPTADCYVTITVVNNTSQKFGSSTLQVHHGKAVTPPPTTIYGESTYSFEYQSDDGYGPLCLLTYMENNVNFYIYFNNPENVNNHNVCQSNPYLYAMLQFNDGNTVTGMPYYITIEGLNMKVGGSEIANTSGKGVTSYSVTPTPMKVTITINPV